MGAEKAIIRRSGRHGYVVIATMPVDSNEFYMRDGPGRTKCTLCGTSFVSMRRYFLTHAAGVIHQRKLKERQNVG